MQGVVKSYDPTTKVGVVISDDLDEYELAPDALESTLFRMLRQGQRILFDLDSRGFASDLRIGSEVDMSTPGFPPAQST